VCVELNRVHLGQNITDIKRKVKPSVLMLTVEMSVLMLTVELSVLVVWNLKGRESNNDGA